MDSLRKEKFPSKRQSKLLPRSDGPFEVAEKINPNAYKIDLPEEYGVSATFNVADLSPYLDADEELPSLTTNSSQAGDDDGDHSHDRSMIKVAQGPRKEVVLSLVFHESSQPELSKTWPIFVTLVS